MWQQFRSDLVALLLPLPLILVLTGIGGYFLASKFLEPIHQMARKAEEITSDRLHERLPVNAADGELADLSRVFNAVLVRLEQSFDNFGASHRTLPMNCELLWLRCEAWVRWDCSGMTAPKDTGM